VIRPAERTDIPKIWALINELADYEKLSHAVTGSAESLERDVFDKPACTVFVYELDDEVIGYTLSFSTYSTFRTLPGVWLEDLYITPEHRGKGFGKQLMNNLIRHCSDHGLGRLEWSVLDWNEPSIQFYKAMGADVLPDWRICRVSFPDCE